MVDFVMPHVSEGFVDGWGPPANGGSSEPQLGICDFVEHLEKFPLVRIGRICDFTASGQRFAAEKGRGKNGKGAAKGKGVTLPPPGKDDDGFSLVDSKPMPGKSAGRGRGGGFAGRSKGRGKGPVQNYQEGILGQKQKTMFNNNAQKGAKGKGKSGAPRRGGVPSFKEWSVHTKPEWEMRLDFNLSSLAKLQLDAKDVKYEDLKWCGTLHNYDKKFDRITAKTESPMRRFEDLEFFNVATSDDPNLQEFLQEDEDVCMIATDQVLACLIAAARSVYSWDIVITKFQNKLIFDKRSQSGFVDFLSVNETAAEPPNGDDKENINSPVKLSHEASCINQNFSQMVLDAHAAAAEMEHPNPFEPEEEDTAVASGAYRYRKITLPGNPKDENEFKSKPVHIVVRTEVNCKLPDSRDNKGLVSVKALNEFNPQLNYSWRTHLDTARGRVLATELTNNAFKLGRWTAQAILAGCDTMKIGYVSRQQNNDPWSHTVLGVQTHLTDGFAEQIGLTRNNMFGILRTIIDLVMQWEDGKYLLLKDPMKSVLRLYSLPWDAFKSDDEDGDGDMEEEEERELDEDGNVVPNSEGPVRG